MQKIQRLTAIGAMAALTVALGACGSSETPSAEAPASSAPASEASSSAEETSSSAAASDGVTTIDDIFGPACDQVPSDPNDPGSAQGMIDDPVATAASNNPLLSTLVTAVGAVDGLADTLNSAEALTVFAPFNGAFDAVEESAPGTIQTLLDNPDMLAPILQGHVSATRYDAEGLVAAGTVDVLSEGTVTIGGTADAPTFDGGNGTAATNLCGNVPTANATVFVIDTILMPAS